MTILPLIGRELRLRARSRILHWARFTAALAGVLLCIPIFFKTAAIPGYQAILAHSIFTGIALAAFILCASSGFLVVDGISRERREGTLGLLCLTKVRGLDVLLGNFGAGWITCLCALLAFLPVTVLPVLAGGVTGYFWLIRRARRKLAGELTSASSAPLGLTDSVSEMRAKFTSLITKARRWPSAPQV